MHVEPKPGLIWRFGAFEMDGRTAELRRNGIAIKLQEQPAQLLLLLLDNAGDLVSRTDMRQKLWPADTFVEFDHALNTAVMKLREALGDSSERPLYIQTIPRKGYRFIAPVVRVPAAAPHPLESEVEADQVSTYPVRQSQADQQPPDPGPETEVLSAKARADSAGSRMRAWRFALKTGALLLLVAAGARVLGPRPHPAPPVHALTRLTFGEGLQDHPTWSPDGRFIAYSSNKGGSTNIWVQQISGGDPIQVTQGPGPNWEPDWSPDGKSIAFRSDAGAKGIFIIPALGGAGQARMIAPFGYEPRWSPDSTQLLFETVRGYTGAGRLNVVGLKGEAPRELLTGFFHSHQGIWQTAAAWHPDGHRVTFWALDPTRPGPSPIFWTVSLDGKQAVETLIPPALQQKFTELGTQEGNEWSVDSQFRWAPAGDALYFDLTLRGARSIWRLAIDPQSLNATGLERLTTGGTLDTASTISPDGKTVAFAATSKRISAWMFPLDANHGRITGKGQPVTSPGIDAWLTTATPDSSKLAFAGIRAGEGRLWVKSLPDGVETPLFVDDYFRHIPQWSRDGKYLAYNRSLRASGLTQMMIWSADTRQEQPLTSALPSAGIGTGLAFDWSPDGKTLLVTEGRGEGPPQEARYEPVGEREMDAWALPIAAAPRAESQARIVISDPHHSVYQEHFSPDGRWIAFETVESENEKAPGVERSDLYLIRASGGPWIPLTHDEDWADKPRWSPDGRLLYFLSAQGSFYQVMALPFDPERGRPTGPAFRVISFDSPGLSVPPHMGNVEISVTRNSLVLTLQQVTGSIWMLK